MRAADEDRKGRQGDGHRAFTPKAWVNGGRRCPVFFMNSTVFTGQTL